MRPPLIVRLDWTSAWTAVASGGYAPKPPRRQPRASAPLRSRRDFDLPVCRHWRRKIRSGRNRPQRQGRARVRATWRPDDCRDPGQRQVSRQPYIAGVDQAAHTHCHRTWRRCPQNRIHRRCREHERRRRDATPAPILVLGGKRQPGKGSLDIVKGAVEAGAAGVFFGRNIFQSPNISELISDVRAVLNAPASEVFNAVGQMEMR